MADIAPRISQWVLLLGGVGFACGFVGPILLNPEANQGPLLGIFITGPGGVLLGLVLGLAFKWLPITSGTKWMALASTVAIGALAIFYFCFPNPKVLGYVIDGPIAKCVQPAERIDAAVEYWNKRIAVTLNTKPREGWQQDTKRMLQDEGAVVELTTSREASVLENRKPWNRGEISLSSWREQNEKRSYFARFNGSECDRYQGSRGPLYATLGQGSSVWPPNDLQIFLNLALIEPLPERYRSLVK